MFIAIEWGTTRIRGRLLTADGDTLDTLIEEVRLIDLDRPARIARLQAMRARWPDACATMWLAGMIGSPMGLETVEQLPCPATPAMIATYARRTQIGTLSVAILPGLSCTSRFGDPDILRGEEVAAAGLIETGRRDGALLLSVPGMHGKWIELGQTAVERFHTSMTVELHRILAERSILAPLMGAPARDGDAFRAGLSRAADGGGLGRLLFSARTAVQAKRFSEEDAASYLWGILIGSDVRENLPAAGTIDRACFVTGLEDVAPLFHAAIHHLGMKAELIDDKRLSATGFATIRQVAAGQEQLR